MPRSVEDILRHADELAARFEDYEPDPAQELDVVPGIENPSDVVKRHVGTRAVAEPAALLAAAAEKLLVPKQTYTEEGAGRSMTLAVARVPFAARQPEGEVASG